MAGRLHKPVNLLEVGGGRTDLDAGRTDLNAGRADLETALRSNLASALSVALLGLPADFAERELYLAIASISYTGDLRCQK